MLDGGAPFYNVYKSKDGVWFTVACIEPKFYKNFLQVCLRELHMPEKDYAYLIDNQINQDEWPDMKVVIQDFFRGLKAK